MKHHFICYVVNAKDELLELDGTKAGPLVVKTGVKKEDLMLACAGEIQRKLADGEISERLSLMCIGPPGEM